MIKVFVPLREESEPVGALNRHVREVVEGLRRHIPGVYGFFCNYSLLLTTLERHAERLGVFSARGCAVEKWKRFKLGAHAQELGDFSLVFRTEVGRDFGAQPAFYLTGPRPGLVLLSDPGDMLARHLFEAHRVLFELKELTRDTGSERKTPDCRGTEWRHTYFPITIRSRRSTRPIDRAYDRLRGDA